MAQSIEESFFIDLLITNNVTRYVNVTPLSKCNCGLLTLRLKVDELMNYFKIMDRKAKIALADIKKFRISFLKLKHLLTKNKACSEECNKENISVNKVFFSIKLISP